MPEQHLTLNQCLRLAYDSRMLAMDLTMDRSQRKKYEDIGDLFEDLAAAMKKHGYSEIPSLK